MSDESVLLRERQALLDEIEQSVVEKREAGDEEAAAKILTEAIDSGKITIEEAGEACYLKEGEKPISPTWFVEWLAEYEREKAKATGLPYEHITTL